MAALSALLPTNHVQVNGSLPTSSGCEIDRRNYFYRSKLVGRTEVKSCRRLSIVSTAVMATA
jgi:hypothetical protein